MRNDTAVTGAGKQYAEAHAAHHTTKDLHEALALYKAVMAAHPTRGRQSTPERRSKTS